MHNKFLNNLSIATTVHNNSEMSAAMLCSFEKYIGSCEEIVIVDDGSREPFEPPVLESPLRLLRNEQAHGFCKASDMALRAVKTDFAILVDADVLFEDGDFTGAYDEFCKDTLWSWVNFQQTDFQGRPQDSYELEIVPPWIFGLGNQVRTLWVQWTQKRLKLDGSTRIADVKVAHSSCALVRMEAYRKVEGFDHWYWQCESDVDLSLRFLKHGFRVGVDLGYQVKHEGSGGKSGEIKRTVDLYRARLHLYEHFFPSSRYYLRGVLLVRHMLELLNFTIFGIFSQRYRKQISLRRILLKTVLFGY
jgi:GT2 family glycosyltransferase